MLYATRREFITHKQRTTNWCHSYELPSDRGGLHPPIRSTGIDVHPDRTPIRSRIWIGSNSISSDFVSFHGNIYIYIYSMPGSVICVVYIYSHETKYELHIAKKFADSNYFHTSICLAVVQEMLLWQPVKYGKCSQTSRGVTFTLCFGIRQRIGRS